MKANIRFYWLNIRHVQFKLNFFILLLTCIYFLSLFPLQTNRLSNTYIYLHNYDSKQKDYLTLLELFLKRIVTKRKGNKGLHNFAGNKERKEAPLKGKSSTMGS